MATLDGHLRGKELSVMSVKFHWLAKRALDILGSLSCLLVFSPLFLVCAIFIKLTSKGSVFYVQDRPGKANRMFKFIKFRSMLVNGDELLQDLLKSNSTLREEWNRYKKLKSFDPRVTKIGRMLRKYNLDELPQLINVLKGDMTLVGPRPYLPREFEAMGEFREIILAVKPGLTGPWQVGGRNDVTFEERLKIDVNYVQNGSLKSDLICLLKTIPVLLKGTGF